MRLDFTLNRKTKWEYMKQNNPWPVNKELTDHMLMRQLQHREKGLTKAEEWFFKYYLSKTNLKWNKQCRWGFRLFDFWNHHLGLAVEVDGPEHNTETDLIGDFKEWERSRIITIRVRNFNKDDARYFLERLPRIEPWNDRRVAAGFIGVKAKLMPYSKPKSKTKLGCEHILNMVPAVFKDGSKHIREICTKCNRTFRFVPRGA